MYRTFACVVALAVAAALAAAPPAQSATAKEEVSVQAQKKGWKVYHHGKDPKKKGDKVHHSSHDTEQGAKNQVAQLIAEGFQFVIAVFEFLEPEDARMTVSRPDKRPCHS
jgi:hypothetical protein